MSSVKRMAMIFGKYFALLVAMSFTLLPFIWLVSCSFKIKTDLFSPVPHWIPVKITFDNYKWALSRQGPNLLRALWNSTGTSFLTASFTLMFASTGAYAMARFGKIKGFATVGVLLLISQMFQGPLVMVPWYKLAASLKLLNTWTILILIYLTCTIPISIWLMRGYFAAIPPELEEAAYIDGCNPLHTFLRIVIPITAPGLTAVFIYAFILSWNDYQYAMILCKTIAAKTVQVGVGELLQGQGATSWGGILASGVIITTPAILLFSFVQKYLIAGLTAGAVKG